MIRRSGSGKVRHLDIKFLWIQQAMREKQLEIGEIDTSLNTSDLGTKYHLPGRFMAIIDMMPIEAGKGRPMPKFREVNEAGDFGLSIVLAGGDAGKFSYFFSGWAGGAMGSIPTSERIES